MNSVRNIYKGEIDFEALALQSVEFSKYFKPNNRLDFGNPAAVRQLTKSLLERDFHLKVDLPDDRLCPPVPNRLNYILWLQDLLDSTGPDGQEEDEEDEQVIGLDIGTGCCSIYPLLGCALRPQWKFIATDIDSQNIETARKNVAQNGLQSRIRIIKTETEDPLIPLGTKIPLERVWKIGLPVRSAVLKPHAGQLVVGIDFTMCNPPFYGSREDMISAAAAKEKPPFSACTGAEIEMVTVGGEVDFVLRMLQESRILQDNVTWYTSMFGMLSSVSTVVENLKTLGNDNYAVTEFVQGTKTKRWAVAWSWTDWRPAMHVARGIPGFPKHLLPFPSDFTFYSLQHVDELAKKVNSEMSSIPLQWEWNAGLSAGTGYSAENVWSRQARRKRQQQAKEEVEDEKEVDIGTAALGFKISLQFQPESKKEGGVINRTLVTVRWLKGVDSVLFESFCGMLKRKLEER